MRGTLMLVAISPVLLAACASSGSIDPPERIIAVDGQGSVMRQSTAHESSVVEYAAPMDRVWNAVMLAYGDLGIDPAVADRANGVYGTRNFLAPKSIGGRPLGDYFRCGSGLTGGSIESGRLTLSMVTTLSPAGGGATRALTRLTGMLRRSDGSSTEPVVCASAGALEARLRAAVQQHLSSSP
jgi:hypothetical protein